MKFKVLSLSLILTFSSIFAAQAKRSGIVRMPAIFKKAQSIPAAGYSEDADNNTATLSLGARKKFTSASIIITFNNLLDQVVKGAEFTTATTGETDTDGIIKLNILAAKFKDGSGFEYSTFQDDESTVKDVKVQVLKVSKKTGKILLRVKATFDNVRFVELDENSEEGPVTRANNIQVFGKVKYDPNAIN